MLYRTTHPPTPPGRAPGRPLAGLIVGLLLVGCSGGETPAMTLESLIELEGTELTGSLAWVFWDRPPSAGEAQRQCEIYERLEGFQIDLDADLCPSCLAIYHAEAALEESSCEHAPAARELNLGFAPIEATGLDLQSQQQQGHRLLVRCDWEPHEGELEMLSPLFAGRLTTGGEALDLPSGTYVLESLYEWQAE